MAARETISFASSNGWRSAPGIPRLNSGSSSGNSTQRRQAHFPQLRDRATATSKASEAERCGERNGPVATRAALTGGGVPIQ